jgi:hypothetical protein
MTSFNLHGFLAQTRVTISLDLSSSQSKISHSVVHALDLAAIFTESSHLTCIPTLVVPTLGGRYSSCLGLVVNYSLPTDAVLGTDWVLPLSSSVVLRCSTGVLLYLYRWFTCCVQVGWLVVKDSTNNSTG